MLPETISTVAALPLSSKVTCTTSSTDSSVAETVSSFFMMAASEMSMVSVSPLSVKLLPPMPPSGISGG